jgi:hypothetical protein
VGTNFVQQSQRPLACGTGMSRSLTRFTRSRSRNFIQDDAGPGEIWEPIDGIPRLPRWRRVGLPGIIPGILRSLVRGLVRDPAT